MFKVQIDQVDWLKEVVEMGHKESVKTNFGVNSDLSTSGQEIWQDVHREWQCVKGDGDSGEELSEKSITIFLQTDKAQTHLRELKQAHMIHTNIFFLFIEFVGMTLVNKIT